ncbi:hypothetical protein HYX58_04240 [Candidatus Dependentiae bacterium]|nr:hypothetical protein [Candidatus Dependentiae bacterium]
MRKFFSIIVLCAILTSMNVFGMENPQPSENPTQGPQVPAPEPKLEAEPMPTKCQLLKQFDCVVTSRMPIRPGLTELFRIAQWPEFGSDTFVLRDQTDNAELDRKKLYRDVRPHKNSLIRIADCAVDLQVALDQEIRELNEKPYAVKGKYIAKGFAQAAFGLGFLAFLAYDIKNCINGGLISREALFTQQTAHNGAIKTAAYATLIGGSIWGLKNGFSNLYKGINLEEELAQAKNNTDDNLVCLKTLIDYRKLVRSELPENEKTPKAKKRVRLTTNKGKEEKDKPSSNQ